jgi:4-amino-4-deoxy-L-arabinose transferase-like glycosyltransferase
MYTAPLYPLVLAVFYRVGLTYRAALAFQAALDSAAVALLADLARRFFGVRAALLTGLLGSASMFLVFHTGLLMTETVTTFLIAVWLWLVGADAEARWPAPASATALGIVVALAMMSRPATQVLVFALVVVWGVRAWMGQRGAVVRLGVFIVTLFIVLLPWMARNYRVMGVFLPTTTAGPYNVFIGWNKGLLETYEAETPEQYEAARRSLHDWTAQFNTQHLALPYWERAIAFQRDAVQYVTDHPGAAFRLWLYKLLHYVKPGVSRFDYPWPFVLASWLWETSLFGLALVGLRRRWTVAPAFRTVVLLAIAASWILHSLIHVLLRYRIPFVEPVALLYAGAAVGDREPPR